MSGSGLFLAIYGITKKKSLDYLRIFTFIAFMSFIDTFSLILFYIIFRSEEMFNVFSDYFQIFYLSTELIAIIFFYSNIILKTPSKHFYSITIISATILLLSNYLFKFNLFERYNSTFVILEVILINSCFGFILIKSLNNDKSFASKAQNEINKGLFIFINITAPYFLISDYLELHKTIITTYTKFINDIGYLILFFQIYKAHRCSLQK
jgi:hypothetical protein